VGFGEGGEAGNRVIWWYRLQNATKRKSTDSVTMSKLTGKKELPFSNRTKEGRGLGTQRNSMAKRAGPGPKKSTRTRKNASVRSKSTTGSKKKTEKKPDL